MSSDRHSRTQSVTLKRQCLFVWSWRIFRNWWKFKLTAKQNHLIYFFPSHQDRQSFEGHGYVLINVGTFVKKTTAGHFKMCLLYSFDNYSVLLLWLNRNHERHKLCQRLRLQRWMTGCLSLLCVGYFPQCTGCVMFLLQFSIQSQCTYWIWVCLCLFVTKPESVLAWMLSCFQDRV